MKQLENKAIPWFYIIDIVRGGLLIEIQTRHFSEEHFFENPEDMEFLIPTSLSDTFTTADLANALNTSRRFARKMAYCLDRMNLFTRIGKRGNAIVYGRSKSVWRGKCKLDRSVL